MKKTISKQIEERQATLVSLQDQLAAKIAELDNAEEPDVVLLAIDELNGQARRHSENPRAASQGGNVLS
jgi:seryl-tRNA synthetase